MPKPVPLIVKRSIPERKKRYTPDVIVCHASTARENSPETERRLKVEVAVVEVATKRAAVGPLVAVRVVADDQEVSIPAVPPETEAVGQVFRHGKSPVRQRVAVLKAVEDA